MFNFFKKKALQLQTPKSSSKSRSARKSKVDHDDEYHVRAVSANFHLRDPTPVITPLPDLPDHIQPTPDFRSFHAIDNNNEKKADYGENLNKSPVSGRAVEGERSPEKSPLEQSLIRSHSAENLSVTKKRSAPLPPARTTSLSPDNEDWGPVLGAAHSESDLLFDHEFRLVEFDINGEPETQTSPFTLQELTASPLAGQGIPAFNRRETLLFSTFGHEENRAPSSGIDSDPPDDWVNISGMPNDDSTLEISGAEEAEEIEEVVSVSGSGSVSGSSNISNASSGHKPTISARPWLALASSLKGVDSPIIGSGRKIKLGPPSSSFTSGRGSDDSSSLNSSLKSVSSRNSKTAEGANSKAVATLEEGPLLNTLDVAVSNTRVRNPSDVQSLHSVDSTTDNYVRVDRSHNRPKSVSPSSSSVNSSPGSVKRSQFQTPSKTPKPTPPPRKFRSSGRQIEGLDDLQMVSHKENENTDSPDSDPDSEALDLLIATSDTCRSQDNGDTPITHTVRHETPSRRGSTHPPVPKKPVTAESPHSAGGDTPLRIKPADTDVSQNEIDSALEMLMRCCETEPTKPTPNTQAGMAGRGYSEPKARRPPRTAVSHDEGQMFIRPELLSALSVAVSNTRARNHPDMQSLHSVDISNCDDVHSVISMDNLSSIDTASVLAAELDLRSRTNSDASDSTVKEMETGSASRKYKVRSQHPSGGDFGRVFPEGDSMHSDILLSDSFLSADTTNGTSMLSSLHGAYFPKPGSFSDSDDESLTSEYYPPPSKFGVTSYVPQRSPTHRTSSVIESSPSESERIILSDSFLNDTTISLPSPSLGAHPPDVAVMVEEDYAYVSAHSNPKQGATSQHDESWQTVMKESWRVANELHEVRRGFQSLKDPVSRSNSSATIGTWVSALSEEGSAVDGEWRVKAVELWDCADCDEWCQSVGLPDLPAIVIGGGQELSGLRLLQLTDEHLAEMNVAEQRRQQILQEVKQLRDHANAAAPIWDLQQASQKRQSLENSSRAICERLQNLQSVNTKQQQRITDYLQVLQTEQHHTRELLDIPANTRLQPLSAGRYTDLADPQPPTPGHPGFKQLPVAKWSSDDVLAWLDAVKLNHFAPEFKANKVTGKDLAEIDMELLDKLKIQSLADRELVLSKLYELQLSANPPSHQRAEPPHGPAALPTAAAPTAASPKAAPPATRGQRSGSKPRDPGDKRSGRKLQFEEGHPDVRPITPPLGTTVITVWHGFSGDLIGSTLKVDEQSTCEQVVDKLLQQNDLHHDPALFYLAEVHLSHNAKVSSQELGGLDHPYVIQNGWKTPTKYRFELKQKKGLKIKVTCMVGENAGQCRAIEMSRGARGRHVLPCAARTFRLPPGGANNLILMALDKDEGMRTVKSDEMLASLHCEMFRLCDRASQPSDSAQIRPTTSSVQSSPRDPVTREDMRQLAEAREAREERGKEADPSPPDSVSSELQPRNNRLQSLEAQMAVIEASLGGSVCDIDLTTDRPPSQASETDTVSNTPADPSTKFKQKKSTKRSLEFDTIPPLSLPVERSDQSLSPRSEGQLSSGRSKSMQSLNHIPPPPPPPPPHDHLELLQELALLRETLKDKDKVIEDLALMNGELIDTVKQVPDLEGKINQQHQQVIKRDGQIDKIKQELDRRKMVIDADKSYEDVVPLLKHELDEVMQEQDRVSDDQRQLQDHLRAVHTSEPEKVQVLEDQLYVAQDHAAKLYHHQQDINQLLDLVNKQWQKELSQKKTAQLYNHLRDGCRREVVAIEMNLPEGEVGFILGLDNNGRVVVRHIEEGLPLKRGDRLIEVNGDLVGHMTQHELTKVMRVAQRPVKLVVLRDLDFKYVDEMEEELMSVKEDLSLALLEQETTLEDNRDLSNDLNTQQQENRLLQAQNNKQQAEIDKRNQQIEDWEEQWEKARHLLQKIRDIDDEAAATSVYKILGKLQTFPGLQPQSGREAEAAPRADTTRALNGDMHPDGVLSYEDLDSRLPLWESLQSAPKGAVLQALKDQILESRQQKAYLDQLIGAVVDHAPQLISKVEGEIGSQDDVNVKDKTEEFC